MAPTIPATTLQAQSLASDPANSAWVSANAGAGKTFVLARRVVRLLLAGTDPSRILCLTFTKAAAAEMSNRVFKALSLWTTIPDTKLADELYEIEGHRPKPDDLKRARRLFARALETPGGLKIQTIHAFAERLLHQFPLEANVPAHFEILDDQMGAELLDKAMSHVLRHARLGNRPDWQEALALLVDHMGDMDIRSSLVSLVYDREDFARFMERGEAREGACNEVGLNAALANLSEALGVSEGDDLAELTADYAFNPIFPRERLVDLAAILEGGGVTDKKQALILRKLLASEQADERYSLWRGFFLTQKGEPKAQRSLASKKIRESIFGLEEDFEREQARMVELDNRRRALLTLEVSKALFTLAEGVISHYKRAKAARGLMDFDDLIIKAAELLGPVNASAWVHYKLDQGIDHILVDEAQDTNPHQWEIISKLGDEFFVGESARGVDRTIFAVGDEKQSIYSFQGARPKWFAAMRERFAKKAASAAKPFHKIDLQLSFRSTPHILKAVDEVFARESSYSALTAAQEPTVHEAIRHRDPGLVEVWPLIEPEKVEPDDDWTKPLDAQGEASPPVQLARTIAATIKSWLDEGAHLEGSGRQITAGDILILVRKRGAFVGAVNRALKEAGLPVAGADRLALLDHIAIKDLLSLADVMLLPQDDLSLATILKSPLFGLSEERFYELVRLSKTAGDGGRKGPLWDHLRKRAEAGRPEDRDYIEIYTQLSRWQGQVDFQPPFDFFAQILGPEGKRRAFVERLGPEADEVIDELLSRALEFEKNQTPNMQAFLAAMRQGGAEIKRDMAAASGQVRVMTVHGSKGLEAPIVFLVDGTGKPSGAQHHPNLVRLVGEEGETGMMAWKAPSSEQPSLISSSLARHDAAAEEEYLRLLYVGMTRAEDRLYLCGYQGLRGPAENCWYEVARLALSADAEEIEHPGFAAPVLRWTLAQDLEAKPAKSSDHQDNLQRAPLPDWFDTPFVEALEKRKLLQPSKAADRLELSPSPVVARQATGFPHEWEPRRRGTLLHALFEHLPNLDNAIRQERGLAYLDKMASDLPLPAREALLEEALAVLTLPDMASIFAPGSQAEVSIAGDVEITGERYEVSGQIDRLIIGRESVLVVDFKTGLHVPDSSAAIPMDYRTQMALYATLLEPLYPGKVIKSLLFWTIGPTLLEVTSQQREEALMQIATK